MKWTSILLLTSLFLFSCSSDKIDYVEKAKGIQDAAEQVSYVAGVISEKMDNDDFATLASMLTKGYVKLERWDDLSRLAGLVMEHKSKPAKILNRIAWSLLENNQHPETALEAAAKAVEWAENMDLSVVPDEYSEAAYRLRMDWRLSSYLDTYAWALFEQEKFTEAETVLLKAIELDGENPGALLRLAQIYLKHDKAEAAYDLSVKAHIYGDEEAVETAQQAFEQMKDSKRVFEKYLANSVTELQDEQLRELIENRLDIEAPDFTLKDIEGKDVSLSDYKGKIVFVDFWATWCPPCKKELPILQAISQAYEEDNVVCLAISTDEDTSKVIPFIEENGYTFTVLYDEGMKKAYDVAGIPTVFIVDENGVIRYKHVGFRPDVGEIWAKQIEELKRAVVQ